MQRARQQGNECMQGRESVGVAARAGGISSRVDAVMNESSLLECAMHLANDSEFMSNLTETLDIEGANSAGGVATTPFPCSAPARSPVPAPPPSAGLRSELTPVECVAGDATGLTPPVGAAAGAECCSSDAALNDEGLRVGDLADGALELTDDVWENILPSAPFTSGSSSASGTPLPSSSSSTPARSPAPPPLTPPPAAPPPSPLPTSAGAAARLTSAGEVNDHQRPPDAGHAHVRPELKVSFKAIGDYKGILLYRIVGNGISWTSKYYDRDGVFTKSENLYNLPKDFRERAFGTYKKAKNRARNKTQPHPAGNAAGKRPRDQGGEAGSSNTNAASLDNATVLDTLEVDLRRLSFEGREKLVANLSRRIHSDSAAAGHERMIIQFGKAPRRFFEGSLIISFAAVPRIINEWLRSCESWHTGDSESSGRETGSGVEDIHGAQYEERVLRSDSRCSLRLKQTKMDVTCIGVHPAGAERPTVISTDRSAAARSSLSKLLEVLRSEAASLRAEPSERGILVFYVAGDLCVDSPDQDKAAALRSLMEVSLTDEALHLFQMLCTPPQSSPDSHAEAGADEDVSVSGGSSVALPEPHPDEDASVPDVRASQAAQADVAKDARTPGDQRHEAPIDAPAEPVQRTGAVPLGEDVFRIVKLLVSPPPNSTGAGEDPGVDEDKQPEAQHRVPTSATPATVAAPAAAVTTPCATASPTARPCRAWWFPLLAGSVLAWSILIGLWIPTPRPIKPDPGLTLSPFNAPDPWAPPPFAELFERPFEELSESQGRALRRHIRIKAQDSFMSSAETTTEAAAQPSGPELLLTTVRGRPKRAFDVQLTVDVDGQHVAASPAAPSFVEAAEGSQYLIDVSPAEAAHVYVLLCSNTSVRRIYPSQMWSLAEELTTPGGRLPPLPPVLKEALTLEDPRVAVVIVASRRPLRLATVFGEADVGDLLRDLTTKDDIATACVFMLQRPSSAPVAVSSAAEEAAQLCASADESLRRGDGSRAVHLDEAIQGYLAALTIYTPEAHPADYMEVHRKLGAAYYERLNFQQLDDNKVLHLDRAIHYYSIALSMSSVVKSTSALVAAVEHDLGVAHSHRSDFSERQANLDAAIEHLQRAVSLRSEERAPVEWAASHRSLGIAYSRRVSGNPAHDLESAIKHYRLALRVYDVAAHPKKFAEMHARLGFVYSKHVVGSREANLERAVDHFEAAVAVEPDEYSTRNNLATAYFEWMGGDRADKLEQAIKHAKAAQRLEEVQASPSRQAHMNAVLARLYTERLNGDRKSNVETAREHNEAALRVFSLEETPFDWAGVKQNLGINFMERLEGERELNLEIAIGFFNESLAVYDATHTPAKWAELHELLAVAYDKRTRGKRSVNREHVREHRLLALDVIDARSSPLAWARSQQNLGIFYMDHQGGEEAANLDRALSHLSAAARVFEREDPPAWASVQLILGDVHARRPDGMHMAIKHYQSALSAFCAAGVDREIVDGDGVGGGVGDGDVGGDGAVGGNIGGGGLGVAVGRPADCVGAQQSLAGAYLRLAEREGRYAEEVERAIEMLTAAVHTISIETAPEIWASAQQQLGDLFGKRIRGDRRENLERSIDHLKQAILVFTKENRPHEWGSVQNSLGVIYTERIAGNFTSNVERAIKRFEEALEVRTEAETPVLWARTKDNLGAAFGERRVGEPEANLKVAIEHHLDALRVYTELAWPKEWAMTQGNLGNAYVDLMGGDRAESVEEAIRRYQLALRVLTRSVSLIKWAQLQYRLGDAYIEREYGGKKENVRQAISLFEAALTVFTPDALPGYHITVGKSLSAAYAALSEDEAALKAMEDVIVSMRHSRASIISGDFMKRRYAAETTAGYQWAVRLCLRLGMPSRALEYAEESKTRSLTEMLSQRPPSDAVPEETREAVDKLQRSIKRQQEELAAVADMDDMEMSASHRRRLRELYEERDELIGSRVLPYDPQFELSTGVKQVRWEDMRGLLPEGTVAVVWYLAIDELHTFVFTRHSDEPRVRTTSTGALIPAAARFVTAASSVEVDENAISDALEQLAPTLELGALMADLEAEASGCKRLLLVAHRFLHRLPLHAMQAADKRCLLDDWVVAYAPSLRVLLVSARRPPPDRRPGRHLAVINPMLNLDASEEKGRLVQETLGPEADWVWLQGKKATREAVLDALGSGGLQSVLLSTHGHFNASDPLSSHLSMSPSSSPASVELRDVLYESNLDGCQLAVLSACSTGMVELDLSDEWTGLPFGFVLAGCANVVATLWPVWSYSCAVLVSELYEELAPALKGEGELDVPNALREAAMALRRLPDHPLDDSHVAGSANRFQSSLNDLASLLEPRNKTKARLQDRVSGHPALRWSSYVCIVTRL